MYNLSKLILKKMKKQNQPQNLVLTLERAKSLYSEATSDEFKQFLEINFGKNAFISDITERIKNFNDVLEYHGISENDFMRTNCYSSKKQLAYAKLELIESCLNEGKTPKLGEKRWCPYFNIVKGGLCFIDSSYYFDISYGAVAYFCSEKLSDHAGKTFTKEYEEFLK